MSWASNTLIVRLDDHYIYAVSDLCYPQSFGIVSGADCHMECIVGEEDRQGFRV